MHITVISMPPEQHLANLNYTLDANESFVGQADYCQIKLLDHYESIDERQAVFIKENDECYLKNIGSKPIKLNGLSLISSQDKRALLSDGDVIECGNYHLAFSNFKPWVNDKETSSSFGKENEESNGYSSHQLDELTNTLGEEDIYDPFEDIPVTENKSVEENEKNIPDDLSLQQPGMLEANFHEIDKDDDSNLIDLFDDEPVSNEPVNDLWLDKPINIDDHNNFFVDDEDYSHVTLNKNTDKKEIKSPVAISYQKNNNLSAYNILQALDLTLYDISPFKCINKDNLHCSSRRKQSIFKDKLNCIFNFRRKSWRYNEVDHRYQRYYRNMLDNKHHRMLFIKHLREILKNKV
ncbi:MAG: FHA domain-containing protein [Endozoicomonas sp. (ex Botrylloides leachii)]|nr:FHA domain-containing protein [Endozoicomonas sp. (ex Botrylloides leachii)]